MRKLGKNFPFITNRHFSFRFPAFQCHNSLEIDQKKNQINFHKKFNQNQQRNCNKNQTIENSGNRETQQLNGTQK